MKKSYSLTFEGDYVKAVMPRELVQEIMRVQAEDDTDFPTACKLVAERANSGSEKFKKKVKDEAERLYRSRHFTEMNKALYTKYVEGVKTGKEYAKISSSCSKNCGKMVIWNLCDERDLGQVYDILRKGGIENWYHTEC